MAERLPADWYIDEEDTGRKHDVNIAADVISEILAEQEADRG